MTGADGSIRAGEESKRAIATIPAVGAYVPRYRISAAEISEAWGQFRGAGIREKSVPAADEDTLTMAYEAGRRALDALETNGSTAEGTAVDWLGFATSNPPLVEEDLTARLAAMLGVSDRATTQFFTGSTRAGTRALWAGIDSVREVDSSVEGSPLALVVASDAPRGEPDDAIDHAAGAGAGAFVLEKDSPERNGAIHIVDRATYNSPYPGTRFRRGETTTELGVTTYARRAFVESIDGAVDGLEKSADPDVAAIQAPDGKLPYRVASTLGVDTNAIEEVAVVHDLGDLGAASVPVTVARALSNGNAIDHNKETILAVGYGSGGGADAFVLESKDGFVLESDDNFVPANVDLVNDVSLTYSEYLRQRGIVSADQPVGGGAYVSVPTWRRSLPQRYRLEAGRCRACGALTFPPEGVCAECGELDGFDPVELPREGTIVAATTISQGGAPPEFATYQSRVGAYASLIVAFEKDGDIVNVPAIGTDAEPVSFEVGTIVETTIRQIYTQEGVTRYGFKVRPTE